MQRYRPGSVRYGDGCYDKINSNKAFIYASPLAPILPQWAQAGNIFLCGTSKNYLKRGMLDKGGGVIIFIEDCDESAVIRNFVDDPTRPPERRLRSEMKAKK